MISLVLGWFNILMIVNVKHILRNKGSGDMFPMNTSPKFFSISVLEDNSQEQDALEY